MTEYVEKLFELATTYGHPNLTKFGELVNDEMWWVVTEIVSEQNVGKRIKLMKQFIKVRKYIHKNNGILLYFVTKILLTYCEKKLF